MNLGKMSHLKMSKYLKNSNFRAVRMVKRVVFRGSKWSKSISHKIWVAEKSWNFHIVHSQTQLGCPGLYIHKIMLNTAQKQFFHFKWTLKSQKCSVLFIWQRKPTLMIYWNPFHKIDITLQYGLFVKKVLFCT